MTQPTIRREDLISRKSAAAHLGLHPNTLDREADRRSLKKHRVLGDNQVYYLRSEVEKIQVVREVSP